MNSGFALVLIEDVRNAHRSVKICAPYINPKMVEMLLPAFAEACERGVELTCILDEKHAEADPTVPSRQQRWRKQESLAVSSLEECGCKIEKRPDAPPGLAVIDEKIVWYGTLPLLAFPRTDDCSLRFENAEAAAGLLD